MSNLNSKQYISNNTKEENTEKGYQISKDSIKETQVKKQSTLEINNNVQGWNEINHYENFFKESKNGLILDEANKAMHTIEKKEIINLPNLSNSISCSSNRSEGFNRSSVSSRYLYREIEDSNFKNDLNPNEREKLNSNYLSVDSNNLSFSANKLNTIHFKNNNESREMTENVSFSNKNHNNIQCTNSEIQARINNLNQNNRNFTVGSKRKYNEIHSSNRYEDAHVEFTQKEELQNYFEYYSNLKKKHSKYHSELKNNISYQIEKFQTIETFLIELLKNYDKSQELQSQLTLKIEEYIQLLEKHVFSKNQFCLNCLNKHLTGNLENARINESGEIKKTSVFQEKLKEQDTVSKGNYEKNLSIHPTEYADDTKKVKIETILEVQEDESPKDGLNNNLEIKENNLFQVSTEIAICPILQKATEINNPNVEAEPKSEKMLENMNEKSKTDPEKKATLIGEIKNESIIDEKTDGKNKVNNSFLMAKDWRQNKKYSVINFFEKSVSDPSFKVHQNNDKSIINNLEIQGSGQLEKVDFSRSFNVNSRESMDVVKEDTRLGDHNIFTGVVNNNSNYCHANKCLLNPFDMNKNNLPVKNVQINASNNSFELRSSKDNRLNPNFVSPNFNPNSAYINPNPFENKNIFNNSNSSIISQNVLSSNASTINNFHSSVSLNTLNSSLKFEK